ncbi:formate dehydrogenase subunit alpha [Fictibacillus sp. KIGAM418]|uniref:Formate dehydrogenase subunit alpha n=1 Tax=Fictibacillus marinisediminis TaxID=2878389 RepID=A0A9X2BFT3_9BACL|nr:formate dehydrogenase subunit alpha [Fictibacillus marinisediminis]MCK6259105.1 formate dehydrogenase subunit alpha [Fictibacillus marinisediminis]
MKKEFSVIVNGDQYQADQGQTVLQLLLDKNIEIPHVCYHESLGSIETCDTCAVLVNGEVKRGCGTFLEEGMDIRTSTPEVKEAQFKAMDNILENHELYCTVCDNNNGDCTLHNTVKDMGLEHQIKEFKPKQYDIDHGQFYRYDPDQCILCGRCVEVCQTVEVNETLSIDWDLMQPRVIWDDNVPIEESSCVSCGQCVTVCPCNALMENSMQGQAGFLTDIRPDYLRSMIEVTKEAETGFGPLFAVSDSEAKMREDRIEKTKTVCTYCGVGCSFEVWTKDREILKIEPVEEAPANGISSCIKGKFGWGHINSEARLIRPLVRDGEYFKEVEWEEAISLITEKFKEIKEKHGPDSLAFIASSKATNEESYLIQKLARQVIGTNNIDNCSRYCQSPATMGLQRTVGYGGDAGSMEDLENAELVIIVGSNTAEAHPVLASKIKRAHKLFGQKLIVADLRKHEMAERADLYIHPNPGTDLVWLSAVTKYIIDQGWHDKEFLSGKVNGYADYLESLQPFTLGMAEEITGISKEVLIQTAEAIRDSDRTCICWAMGVTQHQIGSDTSTAISNLLLVTGNYGRPGTGAYPLRGHNNVQGASDFGSMPDTLPGYQKVTDDKVIAKFEKAWGVNLPREKGMDNHEMVQGIHDGKLKALYVTGEDMGVVDSNINYVTSAFKKLDFFIVQDLFLTNTAQYADVVLPASPSLEKEGTFTNTERRIQRLYPALSPLGESKPDWEIYSEIARRMGFDWSYTSPADIMAEAASLVPMFAGVSYERLEGFKSLQWPVSEDGKDTPLLYTEEFHTDDGKAKLYPLEFAHHYRTTEEHNFHINNGRILEHFHEGNMTYHTEGIRKKVPNSWIAVSEEAAEKYGMEEGSTIRMENPSGETVARVHVSPEVFGNEMYLPLNDNGKSAINYLTNNDTDKDTNTPAYKEIPAKVEVLEKKGDSPLPLFNYRRGHRNPQPGVNVQKKWDRSDYIYPGSREVRQDG